MRLVYLFHLICTIILGTTLVLSHAQDNDDKTQSLAAHNKARAEVGVGPLVWNHTLESYAQNYSQDPFVWNYCAVREQPGSNNKPYGENTAAGGNPAAGYRVESILSAVNKVWVVEKRNYDHKSNVCINGGFHNGECKHYTQMVWNDTSSVGCASTECGTGWVFAVCLYYPPGNVFGKSPY